MTAKEQRPAWVGPTILGLYILLLACVVSAGLNIMQDEQPFQKLFSLPSLAFILMAMLANSTASMINDAYPKHGLSAKIPWNAPQSWKLTMISGVARSNDYVVGIFHDEKWARVAGEYFLQRDRLDHPEYSSFTVEPA